jgi:acyl carrier protein
MTTDEISKIKRIFCEVLGVETSEVDDSTAYNSFAPWDSLKHLQLVAMYEDEFDIEFDMDDIIAMENFGLVKEIVSKYIHGK